MIKDIKKTFLESIPPPKKSIVYSNIHNRVMYLQSKIVNYLDTDYDIKQHKVIVVHVKLSKDKKCRYTQFFFDPEHPDDVNINILCATSSVGNVGLDSPHTRDVFQREFPPSPMDFFSQYSPPSLKVC